MARSLSNARVFVSLVSERLSIARRGFAASSEGLAGARIKMGKASKEEMPQSAENSWVPDPVTGYYRPANRGNEIDVAELREILLKQKISSQ